MLKLRVFAPRRATAGEVALNNQVKKWYFLYTSASFSRTYLLAQWAYVQSIWWQECILQGVTSTNPLNLPKAKIDVEQVLWHHPLGVYYRQVYCTRPLPS